MSSFGKGPNGGARRHKEAAIQNTTSIRRGLNDNTHTRNSICLFFIWKHICIRSAKYDRSKAHACVPRIHLKWQVKHPIERHSTQHERDHFWQYIPLVPSPLALIFTPIFSPVMRSALRQSAAMLDCTSETNGSNVISPKRMSGYNQQHQMPFSLLWVNLASEREKCDLCAVEFV